MKTRLLIGGLVMGMLISGCTDREAEARRVKDEADAKARAEAARKEMEALPKTFQTPDYFKKNQAVGKPTPASGEKRTNQ